MKCSHILQSEQYLGCNLLIWRKCVWVKFVSKLYVWLRLWHASDHLATCTAISAAVKPASQKDCKYSRSKNLLWKVFTLNSQWSNRNRRALDVPLVKKFFQSINLDLVGVACVQAGLQHARPSHPPHPCCPLPRFRKVDALLHLWALFGCYLSVQLRTLFTYTIIKSLHWLFYDNEDR